jgi:hypothetical protein
MFTAVTALVYGGATLARSTSARCRSIRRGCMTRHTRVLGSTALLALLCLLVGATLTPLTSAEAASRNAISKRTLYSMTLTPGSTIARGIANRAFVERSGAPISPVRLDTVLDESASATRPQCHESDVHVTTTYDALCWSEFDDVTAKWYPQGITGSGDGSTGSHTWAACRGCPQRQVVAVSWHNKPNTLARVSFVDVTSSRVGARYNNVLLVEPDHTSRRFHRIQSHADGLAWYGNMLYLVSSGSRLVRVFDLRHIWRVSAATTAVGCDRTACSAAGTAFALPQIGSYTFPSAGACERGVGSKPCFSSVSVDRSTNPDSLITTEFTSHVHGRVLRWPLDARTGKLRTWKRDGLVRPWRGWRSPVRRMQGATFFGDRAVVAAQCQDGAPAVSYMHGEGAAVFDHHAKACLFKVDVAGDHSLLRMRYWTTVPANIQNVSFWPSAATLWAVNEFRGDGRGFGSDRLVLAFHCPDLACS